MPELNTSPSNIGHQVGGLIMASAELAASMSAKTLSVPNASRGLDLSPPGSGVARSTATVTKPAPATLASIIPTLSKADRVFLYQKLKSELAPAKPKTARNRNNAAADALTNAMWRKYQAEKAQAAEAARKQQISDDWRRIHADIRKRLGR